MKHFGTPDFWVAYERLPAAVQQLADRSFERLKDDPRHPSLQLKRVGQFWSARVGLSYRALGKDRPEGIVWFWVGHHSEYDRLLD